MIVLEARGKFQNPSTSEKETNTHYTSDSVRRDQAQCWHQVPFLLSDNNQNGCDHKNNQSSFCVTEKCVNQPTNLNAVGYPLHNELI